MCIRLFYDRRHITFYLFFIFLFSPFKLRVRPKFELDKIKIEGPGVSDSRGVKASVPTYFVVDATDAGSGKLDLRIMVSFSGNIMFFDFLISVVKIC